MNPDVNNYFNTLEKWKPELTKLRDIILTCEVNEAYKWMHPCYTFNGKNIVLLHGFKDYCALLFYKGALLKDPENLLVQQTKNVQSARQLRFTDLPEIVELEDVIIAYINEAIANEKAGLKVEKKKLTDYIIPKELIQKFEVNPDFETAFKNLTPGRQKGYLLHFAKPKQSKSRTSRIEKNMSRIFDGYGLTDCVCGLSKRKPNCDGSHKQLDKSNKS